MDRYSVYKILHLIALLLLTTELFKAFACPVPEKRRRTLILTGLAALIMLISGFGMVEVTKVPLLSGWLLVKLVCWLTLTAMAGLVFRQPQWARRLQYLAATLLIVAIIMVCVRPF